MKFAPCFRNPLKIAAIIFVIALVAIADTDTVETETPSRIRVSRSTLSSAIVFPAAYVSYNMRDGYRKFDDTDKYQYVHLANPVMFGIQGGKRFALDKRLRIQTIAEIGWGDALDDEFPVEFTSGKHVLASLYSNYSTFGANADIHILFPTHTQTFFLSAGLGAHVTSFYASLKAPNSEKIENTGFKNAVRAFSPSINIGAGVEYRVSRQRAVAINYNFRFWQSVRDVEIGALFPMGVDYYEFFYSHILALQILLPNPTHGRFN